MGRSLGQLPGCKQATKERSFHATRGTLKIDVMTANVRVSQAVRTMVVRRVRLALSRFGRRVQKVSVRIAKAANPLGGIDRRCRMRAWLQAADDVRAEAINGRVDTAVGRAAARLATGVAWALDTGLGTPGARRGGLIGDRAGGGAPVTLQAAHRHKRRPGPSSRPRAGEASSTRGGKRRG
jgi:ribosome-associated translation inhibitor RaiA